MCLEEALINDLVVLDDAHHKAIGAAHQPLALRVAVPPVDAGPILIGIVLKSLHTIVPVPAVHSAGEDIQVNLCINIDIRVRNVHQECVHLGIISLEYCKTRMYNDCVLTGILYLAG